MKAPCTFAADHDLASPALAEHAATCEACARAARVRSAARRAWGAGMRRDDRTARSARERRLLGTSSVARARRGVGWSARTA